MDIRTFKPQMIINAAAQPSAIDGYQNPNLDIEVNTMGVL
ncbi:CDP-glucose 4,6-dehydratase, partial [Streptococcus pneumoniae]|nr:CDP-glucose 4,6-dehydratase [Streptococcus pneumoniae]